MSKVATGYAAATIYLFVLVSRLAADTSSATTTDNMKEKLYLVDSLLHYVFEKMDMVGMGIGIVKDGQTVFAKGYGLRNLTNPTSYVTNRTTFQIGSCTKAFTTYAIDELSKVDGILDWDDLVIKHIPKFRMRNDHTWTHATIRDLCSHTTGVPLHERAWIYGNFSRSELLARIPHLQTNHELRARYQYNDIMFAISGLVIERATGGQTWETVIRKRILDPLNLSRTFTTFEEMVEKKADDVAVPHDVPKGAKPSQISIVPFLHQIHLAPSGGIWSSVEDLTTWIQVQLKLSGRSKEMHIPQINVPADPISGNFFGYGLGWRTAYHRGRSYVWHTGGIDGFRTHVALFPEENMGIAVVANLGTLLEFNRHLLLKIADIFMKYSLTEEENQRWVLNEVKLLAESQASTRWRDTGSEGDVPKLSIESEQFVGYFENGGYGVVQVFLNRQSQLVVSLNSLEYTLVPTKMPDYFSARAPFPRELRFDCWFVRNLLGDVYGFRFDLEPMVPPIFFKKRVFNDLYATEYLQRYLGSYGKIEISLNHKEHLLVARGDSSQHYVGKLQPLKRNWFTLERYFLEFVVDNGAVTELNVYEGELITIFKKN